MTHHTPLRSTNPTPATTPSSALDVSHSASASSASSTSGTARRPSSRARSVALLAGALFTVATPSTATAATAVDLGANTSRGPSAPITTPSGPTCEQGEFCLWSDPEYAGTIERLDLRNTNPEECRPLPDGFEARAFANRIDRHVTVYQDRDCATEGDFSTFPGPGTFVPRSPYVVRAVQIWN